jgi:hypothetical protein
MSANSHKTADCFNGELKWRVGCTIQSSGIEGALTSQETSPSPSIRDAVKFHPAVLVVSIGWIQPVPPKHSTEIRGFTLKKMYFTVIA